MSTFPTCLIASGIIVGCLFLSACGNDDNGTVVVPTVTPTRSPSATRMPTNTTTPTIPPTAANTPTFTATNSPTFTVPPTPTATATQPPTLTFTASPTFTATATFTATETATFTATATPTATATTTDTPEATETQTITPTPTITLTPTATGTFGILGERVFTLNRTKSPFQATLGQGITINAGFFEGQTNGEVGPAFFKFVAGQPDPATGLARIDITESSEFIFAEVSIAGIVVCLKPVVPVESAGFVSCAGNFPFGFNLSQDHHLGQIGVDGFTPDDCASMNGIIESPNQICAAGLVGELCRTNADCDSTSGAGDGICGLNMSRCSAGKSGQDCRADADCDTEPGSEDGVCGNPQPHPGVCNGPLNASQGSTDSGPGAVIIAPNPDLGIIGLPVRLSIQASPPCVDPGPGATITFALTSDKNVATIFDFSNNFDPPQTVTLPSRGENFSCLDWTNPNGPGKLVLNAPAIDQNPTGGDIITSFIFSGR